MPFGLPVLPIVRAAKGLGVNVVQQVAGDPLLELFRGPAGRGDQKYLTVLADYAGDSFLFRHRFDRFDQPVHHR